MKRHCSGVILMALICSCATAPAKPHYRASVTKALEKAVSKDCTAALPALSSLADDTRYSNLRNQSKQRVQTAILSCSLAQRAWLQALTSTNNLLELEGDNSYLLWLKISLGDFVDAEELQSLDAAVRLADFDPGKLSDVKLRTILSLLRKLKDSSKGDKRLEFLDTVFKANYTPPDPTAELDGLRMDYAEQLIEYSRKSAAVEQIRLLRDPDEIAKFLIDKRYDNLARYPGMPAAASLQQDVTDYVDYSRTVADANPDRLNGRTNLIRALRMAGKFDDAIREAESATSSVKKSKASSTYVDYEEKAPWFFNEQAYAFYDVGRNADARAAFAAAIALEENGSPNVSQTINLSSMLLSEGLFEESLAAISKLNEQFANPYGKMWAADVRLCARAFQGGVDEADVDLVFIRETEKENAAAYAQAMLCISDLDSAAAQLIRRLENVDSRSGALRSVQRVLSTRQKLPVSATLNERRAAVESHEDVQAAINEVGRIIDLPFYPIYWGEY